jgi:hypothetical protein
MYQPGFYWTVLFFCEIDTEDFYQILLLKTQILLKSDKTISHFTL